MEMELFLILLAMTLIVAAIGWAVFSAITRIDRASTPQKPENGPPTK